MPKPIQLHIPTPCHEDWGKMQPNEKGRHCASCKKTVVDFTGMSDAEIIRYMSQAGTNVCGRLLPDQMNRKLLPLSPVQRNGGKGWQLLLAGLMLTADGSKPHAPEILGVMRVMAPPPVAKVDTTLDVTMGGILPRVAVDSVVKASEERVVCTQGELMGDISVVVPDSFPDVGSPSEDTTALRQVNSSCKPDDSVEYAYTGGITVRAVTPMDTIQRFVKDTLTALRILPRQELRIYPNPVARGSLLHISWQSDPGTYKVNLLSITGALIQARVVQAGSSSQVDTWEMPGGLAAGVYIVQVTRPGLAGGYTQKVVVE